MAHPSHGQCQLDLFNFTLQRCLSWPASVSALIHGYNLSRMVKNTLPDGQHVFVMGRGERAGVLKGHAERGNYWRDLEEEALSCLID